MVCALRDELVAFGGFGTYSYTLGFPTLFLFFTLVRGNMPQATKDLSGIGSILELRVNSSVGLDGHGSMVGSFHYIAGTGTILLEGTLNDSDPGVWFTLVDFAVPPVALAAVAAPGLVTFPIRGYNRIRARNTVGGVGNSSALGFD